MNVTLLVCCDLPFDPTFIYANVERTHYLVSPSHYAPGCESSTTVPMCLGGCKAYCQATEVTMFHKPWSAHWHVVAHVPSLKM